jgi:hypothetical protein
MQQQEFFDLYDDVVDKCRSTVERKNHDYTGGDADALANFKLCENQGLCNPKVALLVRISDKMQRLTTFVNQGELKVNNESAKDAIEDSINYLIFLYALLEEESQEADRE